MKSIQFAYLCAVSGKRINSFENALADKRLIKHLWIEFLFNSEAVESAEDFIHYADIKDALSDALSWHLAFRWLLPENAALMKLHAHKQLLPHPVTQNVYQKLKRNFLKGILHAGLC